MITARLYAALTRLLLGRIQCGSSFALSGEPVGLFQVVAKLAEPGSLGHHTQLSNLHRFAQNLHRPRVFMPLDVDHAQGIEEGGILRIEVAR